LHARSARRRHENERNPARGCPFHHTRQALTGHLAHTPAEEVEFETSELAPVPSDLSRSGRDGFVGSGASACLLEGFRIRRITQWIALRGRLIRLFERVLIDHVERPKSTFWQG
jgi:hypothetical protein